MALKKDERRGDMFKATVSIKPKRGKEYDAVVKTRITDKRIARKAIKAWVDQRGELADDFSLERVGRSSNAFAPTSRPNGDKVQKVFGKHKVLHECPGCGETSHDKGAMVIHIRYCKKLKK